MNIGIIGTRGIPNHYGGFEQFAEYLSQGLLLRGYDIYVYNSSAHPYQESVWNGVKLIHCRDPEDKWGTVGQFIYDLNCIIDARKRNFDIILQLGYTSSSIWGWLLPRKNTVITTNMDGLEWKRSKYSKPVQVFLKFAERLGVVFSDHLISDSIGIQNYILKKYQKQSEYIPYGADVFENPDSKCLEKFKIAIGNYNMLIARLEPENNIEIILDGALLAKTNLPFIVVGKNETKYGEYLKSKYRPYPFILFVGAIYDIEELNNLRYYSNLYFHGHSVGGTNPSLLEAMSSNALICANDNEFNSKILGSDALYFRTAEDVGNIIDAIRKMEFSTYLSNNRNKILEVYSWEKIIQQYANHFVQIAKKKQ
jgi:glycosyltransferase involved in cell wall biosynthesis